MKILSEFEVSDEKYVRVMEKENGKCDVIECTCEEEKIVQPDLTHTEVIGYLSHRLHNIHYMYNKVCKT